MQLDRHNSPTIPRYLSFWRRVTVLPAVRHLQAGLVILAGISVGAAVIVSTYYAENVKLLLGLVGGLAFVLLTMRWTEFGILSLVALQSGLIYPGSLPALHLGPISLHIADIILFLLWGLVFMRATAQRGFVLYHSPLMLPLLLFIGAFMLSAVNAVFIQGVNANVVLRTVRVLVLWTMFIPTLQLVRDEPSLRRLLTGLMLFSGILLLGVLFPNRFSPFLYVEEANYGTGGRVYSGLTRLYYSGDMLLYAMVPVTVASLAMLKKGNQLWRIVLLGLLVYWAFRTGYRQYWLTLAVICILILAFFSAPERLRLLRRMLPALLGGILLLGLLLVFQPARVEHVRFILADRLGSLLNNPIKSESSLQWRVMETRYALIQIERHPLLGIGLANKFRPPFASESDQNSYSEWTSKFLENGYLWIALMMGLVGLIPFLWLCAAYLIRVFQHQHEIRDDELRAVYLGFGIAFLGIAACTVVTPFFVIGSRLIFFPVSMAISETILRLEHGRES